ncbi:electron transport chain complex I subunit [Phanerochaete sordida]|uniref:NADH dehydrogenase [ubiquinone] iron-sulfur protein 4, mitochondrial n=1 Tax=Phanerochaete sordida TaxID=48140 RepID=A0A9P3LLP4_9APHY|nr:electron transport chain complex I subunit [Phanerochaete sordida]
MSLLQPCRQALTRALPQRAALTARMYSSSNEGPSGNITQRPPADVVPGAPVLEVTAAEAISGAPVELRHRAVRIFQPTRSTTQSGSGKSNRWRIDWEILQGGGRWENPLMGWASSADYMQGTRLSFRTKEDAIHFAEKQGWDYFVQHPEVKRIPPKNYAENYVYKPSTLRICRTK